MPSMHKTAVADYLKGLPSDDDTFDLSLAVEVQTDKEMVKPLPCRECKRPLVVTTFFAPAKAICKACKGEGGTEASVGQPQPGQTDPAKAVNLADCLVNKAFARALCPVHPDNEDHVMELKHVNHNNNYGPGHYGPKGGWVQDEPGETVMHQCTVCKAVVQYSTVYMVQFKRQNEPKLQPDFGAPHRNTDLGIRGDDPTKRPREVEAAA